MYEHMHHILLTKIAEGAKRRDRIGKEIEERRKSRQRKGKRRTESKRERGVREVKTTSARYI